jgi:hypothetical protein
MAQTQAASKNLGEVNTKGFVGAAGAGGGFGMNAPGFGPKVNHFAGAAAPKKAFVPGASAPRNPNCVFGGNSCMCSQR